MRQQSFAGGTFEPYRKRNRREQFLAEMDQVVPWGELCTLIEPVYSKVEGTDRRPDRTGGMLHFYFLQQWFNLSDPAVEEALNESRALWAFVCIELGVTGAG